MDSRLRIATGLPETTRIEGYKFGSKLMALVLSLQSVYLTLISLVMKSESINRTGFRSKIRAKIYKKEIFQSSRKKVLIKSFQE